MLKALKKCLGFSLVLLVADIQAADFYAEGYVVNRIRAVGNFQVGTTYDNTIEIWFSTLPTIPASMGCTSAHRLYIDARHTHLVSAAFIAYTTGKKVNFNIDNTLPIRDNSCEVSYLDLMPN